MDKEMILSAIKDSMIKIQNILNLLKDGKQILAYNKILGLNQKLELLYKKISENKNENNTN
jgi:hypothetical protein